MMGDVTWFSPVVWYGFIGAFGLVWGSFLNVLVVRVRERTSLLGRSRCPDCRATLKIHHLIPVFSWVGLGGRCAFCGTKISLQYPVVELLSCALALMSLWRHPFLPVFTLHALGLFLFEYFFTANLLLLATFDARFQLLPLEYVLGSVVVFGGWSMLLGRLSWSSLAIGAAVGFSFLGIQAWVSRGRWLGWGDPWFGLLLGVVLGWPRIGLSLYATYMLGGLVAITLLVLQRVRRGKRLPFVPLLAGGGCLALWLGTPILSWLTTWWHG